MKVVLPREANHEFDVDHYRGLFYITTNKHAKNFRVVTAPMNDPSEKNWTSFIDHNPAIKINGLTFFASHIVVSEREGGLTQLRVIDPETRQSYRISTDEPDFALSLAGNPEFNTTTVRFNYQSMVTPSSVYDYDLNTRAAQTAEAAGSARRLRSVAVRGVAHLGGRARRRQGADVGGPSKGGGARRQGAAAAVRVRFVRRLRRADVLVEPPQPAR